MTHVIGPFLLNGIMFMFSGSGSHVTRHSQNEHSGLNGRREDNEYRASGGFLSLMFF